MTSSEIAHLKTLLQRMKQEDPDYRVFAANSHHYELGPTLSESEIVAFEQQHGVNLPEDYRTFLAQAGCGNVLSDSPYFMRNVGAGPKGGLVSLVEAAQDCDLSQPFPFIESPDLTQEEADAVFLNEDVLSLPGTLALSHEGSGLIYYLVVNGDAYGTIWEGRDAFYRMAPSFDAWYCDWIRHLEERALPVLANERKAKSIQMGMTKAELLEHCASYGGTWNQTVWTATENRIQFENLATEFCLNNEDVITGFIRHVI